MIASGVSGGFACSAKLDIFRLGYTILRRHGGNDGEEVLWDETGGEALGVHERRMPDILVSAEMCEEV